MKIQLGAFIALVILATISVDCFSQERLKVISFNIRYDNPMDGENVWSNRKEAVVKMLKAEKPQIIGLQEVLKGQLDYLTENLEGYRSIGVGREDGKAEGEYSPIIYNSQSLQVIRSGHFWLSQTPEVPSIGWDAACKRIVTWGVFQELESRKQFICINTHFDHIGTLARERSGQLMLDSISSMGKGMHSIIMGDFNAPITDNSLKPLMMNTLEVRSSKAEFQQQLPYTFIGFSPDITKELIDHIFIQGFKAEEYRISTDNYGIKQLSDHLPVICVLSF